MKYILKKDLPFAKAGVKISVENQSLLIPFNDVCLCGAKEHFSYMVIAHEDDIPTLISDGWIEEVKPRELILVLDCSGNHVAHFPTTYTVEEIIKINPTSHQVFKVREVL